MTYNFYPLEEEIYPYDTKWYLTHCDDWAEGVASLTLPAYLDLNGIKYPYGIYNVAFRGVNKITEIHIPQSVFYIGNYAFAKSSIKSIYLQGKPPKITSTTFLDMSDDLRIYVQSGFKKYYKLQSWYNALGGEEAWDTIIQETDKAIAAEVLIAPLTGAGENISKITIGSEVQGTGLMPWFATVASDDAGNIIETQIENNSSNLTTTTDGIISSKVQNLGLYRTNPNSDLTIIGAVPDSSNTQVYDYWYTNSLYKGKDKTVSSEETIYLNAKRIESLALQNRQSLSKVIIGPEVEYISPYAFKGCNNLTQVEISEKNLNFVKKDSGIVYHTVNDINNPCILYGIEDVNSILAEINMVPNEFFERESACEILKIPNNIEYIGYKAFINCEIADNTHDAYIWIGDNTTKDNTQLELADNAFSGIKLNNTPIENGPEDLIRHLVIFKDAKTIMGSKILNHIPQATFDLYCQGEAQVTIQPDTFLNDQGEIVLKSITFASEELKEKYKQDPNWKIYIDKFSVQSK